jgi:hypothetical protein
MDRPFQLHIRIGYGYAQYGYKASRYSVCESTILTRKELAKRIAADNAFVARFDTTLELPQR